MIIDHRSADLAGKFHISGGVDCWPAVIACGVRSLALIAELSGETDGGFCAVATEPTPKSVKNDHLLFLFQSRWLNTYHTTSTETGTPNNQAIP
jgi:hypothetical protein